MYWHTRCRWTGSCGCCWYFSFFFFTNWFSRQPQFFIIHRYFFILQYYYYTPRTIIIFATLCRSIRHITFILLLIPERLFFSVSRFSTSHVALVSFFVLFLPFLSKNSLSSCYFYWYLSPLRILILFEGFSLNFGIPLVQGAESGNVSTCSCNNTNYYYCYYRILYKVQRATSFFPPPNQLCTLQ